jgi:hypothetical protein
MIRNRYVRVPSDTALPPIDDHWFSPLSESASANTIEMAEAIRTSSLAVKPRFLRTPGFPPVTTSHNPFRRYAAVLDP